MSTSLLTLLRQEIFYLHLRLTFAVYYTTCRGCFLNSPACQSRKQFRRIIKHFPFFLYNLKGGTLVHPALKFNLFGSILLQFLRFLFSADKYNCNRYSRRDHKYARDENHGIPPHRHDERHAGNTDDERTRF